MERLYRAYRAGSPEERERLVEEPLLFLKVEAESQKPDSPVLPETVAETVIRELEVAGNNVRRARRRFKEEQRRGEDLSLNEAVCRAWRETHSSFEALTLVFKELEGARLRHTNGSADPVPEGSR
jgi:hypothetical protein